MFARGRSKNAPTDKQNLIRRKQIDTPTDFNVCRGLFILFDKLEFNLYRLNYLNTTLNISCIFIFSNNNVTPRENYSSNYLFTPPNACMYASSRVGFTLTEFSYGSSATYLIFAFPSTYATEVTITSRRSFSSSCGVPSSS